MIHFSSEVRLAEMSRDNIEKSVVLSEKSYIFHMIKRRLPATLYGNLVLK